MKIKVSESTQIQLNWLVAKCEGYTDWCPETEKLMPPRKEYGWVMFCDLDYVGDWAQGGPILEREKLCVNPDDPRGWMAITNSADLMQFGPTPH